MIGLLVSVRNESEAATALEGGADWIDVKEPSHGALGRADHEVVAKVINIVAGRCPVSAALGELSETTVRTARQLPKGLELVKVGLARCAGLPDWRETWAKFAAALPADIGLAAVAYADWRRATSPLPREILRMAQMIGCRVLLVDTFDKAGPNSFDSWASDDLAEFATEVRAAGLRLALAGSLALGNIARALELAPDLLAVRGAACRGGRGGPIDATLVSSLAAALKHSEPSMTVTGE